MGASFKGGGTFEAVKTTLLNVLKQFFTERELDIKVEVKDEISEGEPTLIFSFMMISSLTLDSDAPARFFPTPTNIVLRLKVEAADWKISSAKFDMRDEYIALFDQWMRFEKGDRDQYIKDYYVLSIIQDYFNKKMLLSEKMDTRKTERLMVEIIIRFLLKGESPLENNAGLILYENLMGLGRGEMASRLLGQDDLSKYLLDRKKAFLSSLMACWRLFDIWRQDAGLKEKGTEVGSLRSNP